MNDLISRIERGEFQLQKQIRKECVARIGPGSVGLDKWIKELNERGEQDGC